MQFAVAPDALDPGRGGDAVDADLLVHLDQPLVDGLVTAAGGLAR